MSRAADLFERLMRDGVDGITRMVANAETEELFLDYKRSADDGGGRSLHNSDKSNLSKAVSGFGNSEGGVIVWGVDCRNDRQLGDVPIGVNLIQNPNRFKSWLEQATTGTTVPPHDGVRHEQITNAGDVSGFVVSFIPKGNHVPYQAVPELKYLMRSGSNFSPVPHGVLAGMFGRQPQPDVFPMFVASERPEGDFDKLHFKFGIAVHNAGPGIASDAYLNLRIISVGGPNNTASIEPDRQGVWTPSSHLSSMWNFMLKHDYKLSPDATSIPAIMTLSLGHPFSGELKIKISSGADRAAPYKAEIMVNAEELTEMFNAIRQAPLGEYLGACRSMMDRILQI